MQNMVLKKTPKYGQFYLNISKKFLLLLYFNFYQYY